MAWRGVLGDGRTSLSNKLKLRSVLLGSCPPLSPPLIPCYFYLSDAPVNENQHGYCAGR